MILLLLSLLTAPVQAVNVTILKTDRPILNNRNIVVSTYVHHPKFKGYYVVVYEILEHKRVLLYRTINEKDPLIHHEYGVYWAMCEFDDFCESSFSPQTETFIQPKVLPLFTVLEENEEKE